MYPIKEVASIHIISFGCYFEHDCVGLVTPDLRPSRKEINSYLLSYWSTILGTSSPRVGPAAAMVDVWWNECANYGRQHNSSCTRSFSLIFEANTRSALWLVLYQQLPHAWNGCDGPLLPPIKQYEIGGKSERPAKGARGALWSAPSELTLRYHSPDLLRLPPPQTAPYCRKKWYSLLSQFNLWLRFT